jgi:hypothetical protein
MASFRHYRYLNKISHQQSFSGELTTRMTPKVMQWDAAKQII